MPETPLLERVITAHGGQERWDAVAGLCLHLHIGGNILASRFQSPFPRPLQVEVDTQRIYATLTPFPQAEMRGVFAGDVVRLETLQGVAITERQVARGADGRVITHVVWDSLDLLYFLGYALWNYTMTPYLFRWPGFVCQEGSVWQEQDGALWQTLHVTYPPAFPTHCRQQTFYFDAAGLLRRLDYTAEVFSRMAQGAHYCTEYKTFDGFVFPTRRVVFLRLPSGRPLRWLRAMGGGIEDVQVRWANAS